MSRAAQRRTPRRIAIVVLTILLLAAMVATPAFIMRRGAARASDDARAPENQRVRVEVLNATDTRGLARRATIHLRDRGFDVLEMGNSSERLDSSLVLDRSGHPDWAARVARALGGARVEASPDTSRYLDITVLVGRSWRPPSQPFYP